MNQQDMEVELKVLNERQSLLSHRIKDVDECCGKIRGSTSAEIDMLKERVIKVEENIDSNCLTVDKKVGILEERVEQNKEMINVIDSNLTKIRFLIYGSLILSLAGLILK